MRPARGQAVVELSLGLIVMVTILMFGIHFGEMGYLGAKVHESAAAALWDSTAYRTHDVSLWYDSDAIAVPATNASTGRYSDFDGRASQGVTARSGQPPTMALTQAQPITTRCAKAGGYALVAPSPFGEPGGISCSAQAEVDVIRITTRFLDQSHGFFKSDQVQRRAYTLCATGRMSFGNCGSIQMLLGDDALHDGSEQKECSLQRTGGATCNDNPHFYAAAFSVFNATRPYTGVPEAWARGIVPDVPRDKVTGFYMSFRGEESQYGAFNERVPNGDIWETNPHLVQLPQGQPYLNAYQARRNCAGAGGYCYLGKFDCN